MRQTFSAFFLVAALLPGVEVAAQIHKVSKPEQVVRAVGVYEWTGDLKKPAASRLVPITVFIDGGFEDAGIYLARPIPFALTPGNEYQFEQAGIVRGALELAYASHLQTPDSAYEDGWFGYGSYKAPAAPKRDPVLKAAQNPAVLTSSKDDAHPRLGSKGDAHAKSKPDSAPAGRDSQSTSPDQTEPSQKKGSETSSANDPDRPTMRKGGDSSATPTDPSAGSTGSAPTDDADRPTLRRRSPEEAKKSKDKGKDVATVTGTGSLNDDPDRPSLHHGAQSSANDTDIPKLLGVPKDLQQMVAVSDAANRPPHDFARPWEDEKERAVVLAKMQALARAQLQAYAADPNTLCEAAAKTATDPATNRNASQRRTPGRPSTPVRSAVRSSSAASSPPQVALLDEDLKAYTLSYGGTATYIYTAHTAGTGANLRYVTIAAQADVNGELRPAIKTATDEAHLDRTPRMRFVDVVDAEASNRASLLFELRAQGTRQFALYRVIGARADTIFTTGTTQ